MSSQFENSLNKHSKNFFELSQDMFSVCDSRYFFQTVNLAWSNTLGWSKEELLSRPFTEFIYSEDQESTRDAIQKVLEDGSVPHFVSRFLSKDGFHKYIRWSATYSTDEKLVYLVARDITSMRNRDLIFDELQRAAKIGGWRLDISTQELQWSDETYRIHEVPLGVPVDTVMSENFYTPDAQLTISQCLENCIKKAIPYSVELPFVTAKGRRIWVRTKGYPVRVIHGEVKEIAGSFQDITDSKLLSIKSEKQNVFLEKIIDHLPVALFAKDAKNGFRFTLWNSTAEKLWGLNRSEILGKSDYDFFPQDQSNQFREKDLEVMRKGETVEIPEENLSTPNGERLLHTLKVPVRMEDEIELLVGISLDVTDKKEQESLLREEKEKFEGIINHIPMMIAELSPDRKIEWVNNEWEKGLGWKLNAKNNQFLLGSLPDTQEDHIKLEFLLNYKMPRWEEMRIITHDQHELWLMITAVKLSFGKTLVIAKNITDKKLQEDIIRQQQISMAMTSKLSSLGEMAGGIAHEINNPLAIIVGRVLQLKHMLEKGEIVTDKILKGLAQIEATTLRISKIIKGLKAFSRNSEKDPFETVSIESVINDTLSLCSERFKSQDIEFRVSVPGDLKIDCRPAQISQVLLNLLNNAKDATEKCTEKWIELLVEEDGDFVRVSITDSGHGIPKEIVEKIMEPFFTTKEHGKGTGLGLSISQGIISEHAGTFYYDSQSQNTRFVVLIPKSKPLTQEAV